MTAPLNHSSFSVCLCIKIDNTLNWSFPEPQKIFFEKGSFYAVQDKPQTLDFSSSCLLHAIIILFRAGPQSREIFETYQELTL